MKWYQEAAVKKIGMLVESFGTHLSQSGAYHEKTRGSEREEYACLMMNRQSLPLMAWQFFLPLTCTNITLTLKFGKFQGSLDIFKTLSEFLTI
jgi:hypothetical protein